MSLAALLRPRLQQMDPAVREVLEYVLAELEEQRAMRQEFARLEQALRALEENAKRVWEAIHALTEAQKRTERRVEELAEAQARTERRVEELAEAQARTERRVEELAEAQKRTEARLDRLEAAVAELAEAQARTERRVEELAEAQARTERRVEELAEAQKRTEEEVRGLAQFTKMLHERVEGLSNAVGYSLENRAYLALPSILERRYGLRVEGALRRRYVTIGRKMRQVNIYGYARRDGQKVLIVGEAKVRPSRSEIQRLRKLCEKLEAQEGLPVVPVFVAHDFPPAIEQALDAEGVLAVWSYDIDRELYQPPRG